jgi:electron-transferring-flavoprotein dehydrogenase
MGQSIKESCSSSTSSYSVHLSDLIQSTNPTTATPLPYFRVFPAFSSPHFSKFPSAQHLELPSRRAMHRAIRAAAAAAGRALSPARASPSPPRAPGWGATRWLCSGREALSYDVVIVGAGPAGLAAAIRLKQLCRAADADLSVCVLEKGSEVGMPALTLPLLTSGAAMCSSFV